MALQLNLARMSTATTGTGTITLGSAVSGYLTFALAGAVNTGRYRYGIKDGANSEAGVGVYTSSGTTFTREVRSSTNSNNAISLSGAAEIFITALAEDFLNITPPQGRITLQTAVPVMTTTQSAKTTVYYTPYVGRYVPLYDGTSFNMTDTGGEISVATTDTTKNPAAIGASKVNDWFIWNDAGTIRISHGPDWTSDTARSAGTALVMVNGILLNNASITNGPAASRGTYVGTTRSNGSSQIDYIFGASASGGTAAFFGVWNCYNRVMTRTAVIDSGGSYTYAVATIRQARASAGNQVSFVLGLQEDGIEFSYGAAVTLATTNGVACVGVGFDSTSTFGVPPTGWQVINAVGMGGTNAGYWNTPIGFHFISANENCNTANTQTFNSSGFGVANTLMATVRN